jgi:threonine/homoserine/homoserine lactone efflux protein
MTLHNYLLFVGASIILVLFSGPDMLYMLSRCIAQGRKAGLMAAIGFNLGGYAHLTAAVLGLSAILMTSSLAFTIVKWLGAAYLIYLGIVAILSKTDRMAINTRDSRSGRTILWQAFLSDALNPKVAMFFLALLPQFVDAKATHPTLQILLLGITLNMIALPINMALVFFSAAVTQTLRRNSTVSMWMQKIMGAMFVALGLRLAAEKA